MGQVVLVNNSRGDDPTRFSFRVECTGRRLSREAVLEQGYVTVEELRIWNGSGYSYQWYEVRPGDKFTVTHFSDFESPLINIRSVFRVKDSGMPNPNASLSRIASHGVELMNHLREQCEEIEQGLAFP